MARSFAMSSLICAFPRPLRAKTRALELLRRNPLRADVSLQNFRDNHAAIRLLIVLDDRDPCTTHCQAAAVQGMDELRFVLSIWPVANVGPPCLIGFKVRARRNLAEQDLSGQPYFNVIGLRSRRSHVACAQCYYPVMQAEFLKNLFSVTRESFMLVVGILGPRKLH